MGNGIDIWMYFFGWFYKWRVKRRAILKMKLRPKDEILQKKFDWSQKILQAEKSKDQEALDRFTHYIDVLKWVLNEKDN